MRELVYDLGYLSDPEVCAVGRLPAVSDHDIYQTTAEAQADASSLTMSLNGLWRFHYCEHTEARPIGFEKPDAPLAGWDEIRVPGHIQMQGYGHPQYVNVQYPWDGHEALIPPQLPTFNPVGSYVRFFEVPERFAAKRVVLTFHGAESALYCWVNGQFIGYAEDGFTPSRFDITDALVAGQNRLAVQVHRFSSASWLEDQDFFRFSGLFRDVELTALPDAHVRDVFVHAEPDDRFENATLTAEVKLDLPQAPITLKATLMDANGATVDEWTCEAQAETLLCREVAHPRLWNAEEPYLYTLRLTLLDAKGDEREVAQTRIGFRRFEMKNGLMLLNGKRIVFHGADRHEFCAEAGRAITKEHMLTDIRIMKRHNINAVRTSHYPNQSLWYKLCDEYGIYLIDEANLETHGSWQRMDEAKWIVPKDDPMWLPALIDRATSMQERDKNHPSVLIWSCGNESYGGKDIFEMSEHLRKRDPSRLVHYEGLFNDRSYNDTSDMESQMYTRPWGVEKFLLEHPEKPMILCEYTHAMGNSCGGMHKYVALEDKLPRYQGGFIWDFVDQALWTTSPNGQPRLGYGGDFGERPTDRDFCGNGLIFADRTLTPKLQEVKYLYQPIRITPDASGVTIDNRSLSQNASAYTLRWRLMRDGETVQCGQLSALDVPAGESRRYDLPVLSPTQSGEYVLHCGLYLKQATKWADTEYELMHGSAIVATIAAKPAQALKDYVITQGDTNVGVRGAGYEMLFSRGEGGISSLRGRDARELLCTAPALSLFRAPTNNDIGNHDDRAEALWMAASLLAAPTLVSAEEENGLLCARYRYDLPLTDGASMLLSYTAMGAGRVRVSLAWQGKEGLPDLAAFGVSLRLPRELHQFTYYGMGPEENYSDRKEGAYLGLFTTTAERNLTHYLQPQECGNREGVRFATVTDANGRGVRVEQVDAPLSVSVLPYNPSELRTARHLDELAKPTYTYLDVALCRKGVGGDDSWGAPVHDEYHIKANKPMTLTFDLSLEG